MLNGQKVFKLVQKMSIEQIYETPLTEKSIDKKKSSLSLLKQSSKLRHPSKKVTIQDTVSDAYVS
jgi:hypothetical protein